MKSKVKTIKLFEGKQRRKQTKLRKCLDIGCEHNERNHCTLKEIQITELGKCNSTIRRLMSKGWRPSDEAFKHKKHINNLVTNHEG